MLEKSGEIGTATLGSNLILSIKIGNALNPTSQEIDSSLYLRGRLFVCT